MRILWSRVLLLGVSILAIIALIVAVLVARANARDDESLTRVGNALPSRAPGDAESQNSAPRGVNPSAKVQDGSRTITFSVATKGKVKADVGEFKTAAFNILNDPRGWSQLGLNFKEVDTGGDFTLYLANASEMSTFSAGCSDDYSCRVGSDVIINEMRWREASTTWIDAGQSIADYHVMVINHEVGHWLGHDHVHCAVAGQKAPLMQQQSINLEGCKPNPWPKADELYSPSLGIRLK